MVTIKEIADICHVSATTVSNVINGKVKTSKETERRILAVIEETGYKPNYVAKGLRINRTQTIAVIAEDIEQFTTPPIIESIMQRMETEKYRVAVHNLRLYARWADTWYDQERAYHTILDPVLLDVQSARVDGVIYIAGHARIIRCFNEDFPIPAVMSYAFSDSARIPSVVIDDEGSAREMVSYLIRRGHRRIGFVGGRQDNLHTTERLLGYQKALFENGLLFDPELVCYGDWTRQSGYDSARTLCDKDVTAVFCVSDKMAGGVYDYLDEHGLAVGRDVSVAGFDDESIAAYFRPALTTTALPLKEIGRVAADQLIGRIKNDVQNTETGSPEVVRIPCTMAVRDSVTDPRTS